jgi:enhancing lycopene biosynthesis protein 2
MAKKIGVILSGCGVYDGSEIHEAVITLLAIDRNGSEAVCMAPNIPQMHVVNHLSGEVAANETRNVLVEAARIARGKIRDLATVKATELDALILPGGFGAAKNLCDFAFKGRDCTVQPDLADLIRAMHAQEKPMGFVCIAPVIAARVLGARIQVTIGSDPETAKAIEAMGALHVECPVDMCVVDKKNRIVSTPAYMLAGSIREAADGIERLVKEVLRLAR